MSKCYSRVRVEKKHGLDQRVRVGSRSFKRDDFARAGTLVNISDLLSPEAYPDRRAGEVLVVRLFWCTHRYSSVSADIRIYSNNRTTEGLTGYGLRCTFLTSENNRRSPREPRKAHFKATQTKTTFKIAECSTSIANREEGVVVPSFVELMERQAATTPARTTTTTTTTVRTQYTTASTATNLVRREWRSH